MRSFFKKSYESVRDSFRYHVTNEDLNLLREISNALDYIRKNDPATGNIGGARKNKKNVSFLKNLESCFLAAFMQYDAGEGGPFYRFYREKISSLEDGFKYSGSRKEKDWYIQRHDVKGVVNVKLDRDIELENVTEIFDKLLRPILDGQHIIAKGSRGHYLLDSMSRTKKNNTTREEQLLDTRHMNMNGAIEPSNWTLDKRSQ